MAYWWWDNSLRNNCCVYILKTGKTSCLVFHHFKCSTQYFFPESTMKATMKFVSSNILQKNRAMLIHPASSNSLVLMFAVSNIKRLCLDATPQELAAKVLQTRKRLSHTGGLLLITPQSLCCGTCPWPKAWSEIGGINIFPPHADLTPYHQLLLFFSTRKVLWLHSVVVAPVLAIGNMIDVPRGSQQDPHASFGDAAELFLIFSWGALPDVQHCVVRNLSKVTNNMLSCSSVLYCYWTVCCNSVVIHLVFNSCENRRI